MDNGFSVFPTKLTCVFLRLEMTRGGEMCWLSVALRHQKSSFPPLVMPQMNSLLMRQPYVCVCVHSHVQYLYKHWSRLLASLLTCSPWAAVKEEEVKTAAGWSLNQKIEMSFSGVMFLFALWFTASNKRLFRRRKCAGQPVEKHADLEAGEGN